MIRVLGVDLGRSGKTSFCTLEGEHFNVVCTDLHAISSISGPEIEQVIVGLHGRFRYDIICVEGNGLGGTFVEFFYRDHPDYPLVMVDTSAAPLPLELYDGLVLTEAEYLNIRAEMYWITRLLFKDRRIHLLREDAELFAQLSSLRWDYDRNKNEKIYMITKKNFRYTSQVSELEGDSFSRSPDKADSLCLAALSYAIAEQLLKNAELGDGDEDRDIIDPLVDGFFHLGDVQLEEVA